MSKLPIAGPVTEGRIFGRDWSIANIAKLLRSNAAMGAWDSSAVTGSLYEVNHYYLRKASCAHLPTQLSLIFMRLLKEDCWYASLCFAAGNGYSPWNPDAAERWLAALFGEDRARVHEQLVGNPSVRQFTVSCAETQPRHSR